MHFEGSNPQDNHVMIYIPMDTVFIVTHVCCYAHNSPLGCNRSTPFVNNAAIICATPIHNEVHRHVPCQTQ